MTEPTAPEWQPLRGPVRRLPTQAGAQAGLRGAGAVCSACIAGTCCTSEGPIALTAFDVLRLSAALDLTPSTFFREFTQDRFNDALGPRYREWLDSAESSVVSFLRRRTLASFSPCIFLKYVAMPDGTPRRVCSVHPARPLACREYYHDTCATRWTGELAVLQAEGYEAVRDALIDRPRVKRELRALGPPAQDEPLGRAWRRGFWLEIRRALDLEAANREGAADAGLAALQDPIEDKLNRLLSTANLRFEEKYGAEAHGEQLHRYDAGLSLVSSGERRRLLHIARRAPGAARLYTGDDFPHHHGHRTLVNPAAAPGPAAEASARLTQELLETARRLRQVRASAQTLELAALPLALQEALASATEHVPPASRAALTRARKALAAEALALCTQALRVAAPLDHDQLHGANGLARLLQWGVAPAAEPLNRWLRTPAGRAARRLTAGLVDGLARPAPGAVAAATEWAQAARWLPLMATCHGADLVRRRLVSCWARTPAAQLPPAARCTLADHTLRQHATDDGPGPDPRWAEACAAAREVLRDAVAADTGSMWDASPALLAGLWYDAYMLRAIERAGWRLALASAWPDRTQ